MLGRALEFVFQFSALAYRFRYSPPFFCFFFNSGSGEYYDLLAKDSRVAEALVAAQKLPNGDERVILFLQLTEDTLQKRGKAGGDSASALSAAAARTTVLQPLRMGHALAVNDPLAAELRTQIRNNLSPKHLPSEIVIVSELPVNANGKKLEVLIKRLISGMPYDPSTVANPKSLEDFQRWAAVKPRL